MNKLKRIRVGVPLLQTLKRFAHRVTTVQLKIASLKLC